MLTASFARWTLNALTVLSLVLCAAALALWVRSYFGHTSVYWQLGRRTVDDTFSVSLGRGGIGVGECWTNAGEFLWPGKRTFGAEHDQQVFYPSGNGLVRGDDVELVGGFGFRRQSESLPWRYGATADFWSVVAPIWSVAAVFAMLPLYRATRRRQGLVGHCPTCSYDLTGNVSGVCPECGSAVLRPEGARA